MKVFGQFANQRPTIPFDREETGVPFDRSETITPKPS